MLSTDNPILVGDRVRLKSKRLGRKEDGTIDLVDCAIEDSTVGMVESISNKARIRLWTDAFGTIEVDLSLIELDPNCDRLVAGGMRLPTYTPSAPLPDSTVEQIRETAKRVALLHELTRTLAKEKVCRADPQLVDRLIRSVDSIMAVMYPGLAPLADPVTGLVKDLKEALDCCEPDLPLAIYDPDNKSVLVEGVTSSPSGGVIIWLKEPQG